MRRGKHLKGWKMRFFLSPFHDKFHDKKYYKYVLYAITDLNKIGHEKAENP